MIGYTLSNIIAAKLSAFAARLVTPADAARTIAKHGAEARRLTAAEKRAATTANLADETARFGPISVPRFHKQQDA